MAAVRRTRARFAIVMGLAIVAVGCSSDGTPASQVGGGGASGGVIGSGGVAGNGGGGLPSAGAGGVADTSVWLDLSNYDGPAKPFFIANRTLVFPLNRAPAMLALSAAEPGSLIAHYTRVGCWVNPEQLLGSAGSTPIIAPDAELAGLLHVTIDFAPPNVGDSPSPESETCLSTLGVDGVWQDFLQPSSSTHSDGSTRVEFAVPLRPAKAAAIFLPTYATVSGVGYVLEAL